MPTSTLCQETVDYRPIIRAELLATVERLKRVFYRAHGVDPQWVEIGYCRNLHQGKSILEDWEHPADLPWRTAGVNDVRVGGLVEHEEEYWVPDYNEDGEDEGFYRTRTWETIEMEADL